MMWEWLVGYRPSFVKKLLLSIVAFIAPYVYIVCRLVFGTLYPAYASYKAVRTKNVKEYVKWMMYWIIFALFTCVETFADMFIAWIPFYYEVKIVFVLWLLSPVTKGSSFLYRKFVHPQFSKREKEIDEYIAKASDKGYTTIISLGSKGITYATNVVLQTAIKGQSKLADQIRKSYSMSDLASSGEPEIIDDSPEFSEDELADVKMSLDSSHTTVDSSGNTDPDQRLAEDNRELERKRDQQKKRKKVQRSSSSAGALYSVSEEESDTHIAKGKATHRTTRHEPRYSTRSTYSSSEQKQIDTYATMPRKRVKKRPSLKNMEHD